ncbi:CLUMA_CG005813, isoform A [Clunio marinus]|uniref:CLUMA_CG005813, isoform A n=1 Tax=Clunio marinus TaxID=568069 RepID=A0A1J1HY48_9DIPT|nr:CLUMA_CG005813, isoform A [Clunio marinus]
MPKEMHQQIDEDRFIFHASHVKDSSNMLENLIILNSEGFNRHKSAQPFLYVFGKLGNRLSFTIFTNETQVPERKEEGINEEHHHDDTSVTHLFSISSKKKALNLGFCFKAEFFTVCYKHQCSEDFIKDGSQVQGKTARVENNANCISQNRRRKQSKLSRVLSVGKLCQSSLLEHDAYHDERSQQFESTSKFLSIPTRILNPRKLSIYPPIKPMLLRLRQQATRLTKRKMKERKAKTMRLRRVNDGTVVRRESSIARKYSISLQTSFVLLLRKSSSQKTDTGGLG